MSILPSRDAPISLAWCVLGALCGLKVKVFGEIYVGEILAAAALPLLLLTRSIRAKNGWILLAGFLLSVAQLVSDLYNRTAFESAAKGILAPMLFSMTITTLLSFFEQDARRMYAVLMGVALIAFVQVAVWPNEYQQFQPWKWGYGHATLMVGLLYFSARPPKSPLPLFVGMLLFAGISVLNDARSLAGLPLIGFAAYAFWRSTRFTAFKNWLLQRATLLKLLVGILPILALINFGLGILFTSEWILALFEPSAAAKYRQQAQADVGMLLAGRSEWLVSLRAFLDAPLLGHGSWAQDTGGYLNDYSYLRMQYGMADRMELEATSPLIPAHSFLFGAMVWAGVTGGIFWLFFSYRLIARYLRGANYLPVYFHVGLVLFLWDLLFSPFGAQSRWTTALFAAALWAASNAFPRGARTLRCRESMAPRR